MKKLQGEWKPLLDYILSDSELDLQIRDNYINVYYQGGNILKINPRSFYFDEFYFYKDCAKKRKTPLQEEAKSGNVKAKSIIAELVDKRDCLLSPLQSHQLDKSVAAEYFQKAKKIMRDWEKTLNEQLGISHAEKQEQQQIALANRKNTDYVVLDLEYAVSTDPSSSFKYNGSVEDKKRPRFDIIAIHKGQLIVIELKKGLKALDRKSGIADHIDSYEYTIGRDDAGEFVKEMKELLKQKQNWGILDKSIIINNEEPKFVFAYADVEDKDEFSPFVKKCCEQGYSGEFIKIDPMTYILKQVNPDKPFPCRERERQLRLLQNEHLNQIIFNGASGNGWKYVEIKKLKKKEWRQYPHILQHQDSLKNLYTPVQKDVMSYFKEYDIAWWREDEDRYFPTGNLLSSQIHCLNHLFKLRRDPYAVLSIVQKICPSIVRILPSPIDDHEYFSKDSKNKIKSFISFEFTYNNVDLLKERTCKRGKDCTSIDAFVYAVDKEGKHVLIAIEWKYTETYAKTIDKETYKKVLNVVKRRYLNKIATDGSHLTGWEKSYYLDPFYELARQSLLMEQIISNKPFPADYYQHIVVCPIDNKEMRADASAFKESLSACGKEFFHIIDPQEFLSPISSLKDEKGEKKYADLLDYLETRYWK
ncbi:MAG: hypothetical protein J6X65_02100 [Bacteroidales bacterium]|nr:hypothetical protein [Bacteroidales bacterium]